MLDEEPDEEPRSRGEADDEPPESDESRELDAPEDVYTRIDRATKAIARRHDVDEPDARDLGQDLKFKHFQQSGTDPARSANTDRTTKIGSKAIRNAVLNHLRDEQRLRSRLDHYETEGSWARTFADDRLAALQVKEIFEIAGRELNAMTKERRDLFLRCRMDGFSYREIAAERGMTEDAVGTNVRRAANQIGAALPDYME